MNSTADNRMNRLPFVSVIIPAFNEERYLARCLRSVFEMDYPPGNMEVFVVDNGSTDKTAEIAAELGATVVPHPIGFVGAVRNRGVFEGRGELLAFLDSDCTVGRRWIIGAVESFESNGSVGAVGGVCLADSQATWVERAWARAQTNRRGRVQALTAASMIVKADLFSKLRGFDEGMAAGEDYEFSRRVIQAGLQLFIEPDCAVVHLGWPKSLPEVYRRQVWHGSNQLQAAKRPIDKMVALVHVFTLAPLGSLLLGGTIGWTPLLTYLPLLFAATVVLSACVFRAKGAGTPEEFAMKTLSLVPVFSYYFIGRSVGLFHNYRNLLIPRLMIQKKTWQRRQ